MVRKHYKSFTENSLNKHFFGKIRPTSGKLQTKHRRSSVYFKNGTSIANRSAITRANFSIDASRRVASRRRCTCSSRICSLVARHSSRLKCKNRGSSRHLSSVRPSSPVRPCIYGLQHRLIAIYFLPAKRAICMYIDRHGCKTA